MKSSTRNSGRSKSGASAEVMTSSTSTAMSEFEISLVLLWNTFSRWVQRCANAAGVEGLSSLDLLVLHFLRYRERSLRAVDLAYALAIEDTHLVSYSVKKLVKLGLLKAQRKGKEIIYSPTGASEPSYLKYLAVRQECLINSVEMVNKPGYDLEALAQMLRTLSGIYEQAARSSATGKNPGKTRS